jgi:translation initiation factor IF-2
MSKNELLERMKGASGGAGRGAVARPGEATDDTTTRVSSRVVRRRPAAEKADEPAPRADAAGRTAAAPATPVRRNEAGASTVVRRRAADRAADGADVDAPPPEEAKAAPVAPPPEPEPAPKAAAPVEPAPAPTPAPAPPVQAPPPAPEPPAARVEPAPAPAPEPVAAAPAPAPAPPPAPAAPEGPRFVGLGSAVVRPPPGYDPSNPAAWRRRVEAEAAPPPPDADGGASRRRRVASGGAGRPGRGAGAGVTVDSGRPGQLRGRANPAALAGDMMQKRRRPLKKRSGGGSTVAMKAEKRKVRVDNVISVGQLAHEMGLKATVVIRTLMELGTMVTVNEMLDLDTATLVANEFDYEVENVGFQEEKLLQHFAVDGDDEDGERRPPVVTIMGHVDHGKTTLLDTIRKSRVAAGEAGGITQHIGAYQVERGDQIVTFLDTPGHAAFSAMRARGAQVTDIVVLVVAADDGVQPQTLEAISHAKAAGVPIIVAVNKMDKAGVTAEPIMQALSQHGLLAEQWGGDVQFVPVSALKSQGIDELIESILVQTELLELTAPIDRPAEGIVIEAKVERGRGPVASVLVQRGTLNQGDTVVLGSAFGKVRAMVDHRGKRMKSAGPSTPVEIFGISDVPSVGDMMTVVKSEKDARVVAEHRAEQKREAQFRQHSRRNVDDLFAAASATQSELLYVVLKADVQGSVEALRSALEAIEVDGSSLRILHAGVGNISESDVNLVTANRGLLLGFNVKVDANARKVAEENGVEAELFSVIYDLLDRVKAAMKGLVAPDYEEVRKGSAEVRATFKISRIGTVAGCYILDGKIARSNKARVLRKNKEVWSGPIAGLKRFKDDVREVSAGYECGIVLDGFNEFEDGDVIEAYALEQVKEA